MKPPPFLIGAALLFWGFETGWLTFAAVMAVMIEAPRWTRSRWEFSDADLNRLWDLSSVFFFGALIIRYTAEDAPAASAYQFFQWFPFIFVPMAAGQAYSSRDQIPVSVFSWLLRRRVPDVNRPLPAVHTGYFYVAICLISASAGNRRDAWFLVGSCALVGWSLWCVRPSRVPVRAWAIAFAMMMLAAYVGQWGLHRAHTYLEGRISAWIADFVRGSLDASESRTAMGTIGIRKQSGRIVMRVQHERGPFNGLLRQASYDTFREPNWLATRNAFAEVAPESDAASWVLQPASKAESALMVFTSVPRRVGMLSLPHGTERIESLPVGTLQTNYFGAARVTEPPGLLGYRTVFSKQTDVNLPPDLKIDLHIPDSERPALDRIAGELSLQPLSIAERISAIRSFLQKHFTYSLYVPENLRAPADSDTALTRFLLRTRTGHCEYFATATVLLLRMAQIPARYAVGHSVHESRGSDSRYVVRDRHAHAWTLVWQNNRWEDLDTTPDSWAAEEQKQASVFERISDLFSELRFQFLRWRWLSQRGLLQEWAPWLLAPLVFFLSWRLLRRRQRASEAASVAGSSRHPLPGTNSEFYRIERVLAKAAGERAAGETLATWLRHLQGIASGADLLPLLELHYRLRFDPAGLSDTERNQLRAGVDQWLQRQARSNRTRQRL